jgi:hypothetical protein
MLAFVSASGKIDALKSKAPGSPIKGRPALFQSTDQPQVSPL